MIAGVKKTFVFELKIPKLSNESEGLKKFEDLQIELLTSQITCFNNFGEKHEQTRSLFVNLKANKNKMNKSQLSLNNTLHSVDVSNSELDTGSPEE